MKYSLVHFTQAAVESKITLSDSVDVEMEGKLNLKLYFVVYLCVSHSCFVQNGPLKSTIFNYPFIRSDVKSLLYFEEESKSLK